MRILAFSDWRSQTFEMLFDRLSKEKDRLDYIIYCGDDVERFGFPTKEAYTNFLLAHHKQLKDSKKIRSGRYKICPSPFFGAIFFPYLKDILFVYGSTHEISDKNFLVKLADAFTSYLQHHIKNKLDFTKFIKNLPKGTMEELASLVMHELKTHGKTKIQREDFDTFISIYDESECLHLHIHKDGSTWLDDNDDFYRYLIENAISDGRGSSENDVLMIFDEKIARQQITRFLKDKFLSITKDHAGAVFGSYEDKNQFMELKRYANYILGVIGNDDTDYSKSIFYKYVIDLNEQSFRDERDKITFIGLEGSTGDIGNTLYTEQNYSKRLNKKMKEIKSTDKVILVSHQPPKGILDLSFRFAEDKKTGEEIGSTAINKFLLKHGKRVILNLCGHSHFNGGKFVKWQNTMIVNIASHDSQFANGNLAWITIKETDVEVKIESLLNPSLERVPLIGPATAEGLKKIGIKDIFDLSRASSSQVSSVGRLSAGPERLIKNAKLIIEDKSEIDHVPKIDFSDSAWVDIETSLDGKSIWAISIKPVAAASRIETFFAENYEDEKYIMKEFVNYLRTRKIKKLIYYSVVGKFDERVLLQRAKEFGISLSVDFLDFGQVFRECVLIPSKSYGLKEVAKRFGYEWRCPHISGFLAPMFYGEYLSGKKELKKDLITYNQDDVLAMEFIANMLFTSKKH